MRADGVAKTILIADNAKRTLKYFLALASGTPCLHYNWITHCVEEDAILPWRSYLLPRGWVKKSKLLVYQDSKFAPFSELLVTEEGEQLRFDVFGEGDIRVSFLKAFLLIRCYRNDGR